MTRRLLAASLAAVLCLFVSPAPAPAQTDSGAITIVVHEEDGKAPLELARVILDGPVITSELTDKKGEVRFTDVPDGIYRARIAHSGYQTITSSKFEIINSSAITVNVTLALSTNLKVIGTVEAHSSATVSATTINQDSAQRKLSNDLADALNKLSGVSVQTTSDDSDASQTISLEGHDASQTQMTLNGIPMNAPGVAGNLRGFATDLFGSASVKMGPQLGGLGGGVNFATLQPTLSWMSQLQLSTGTNGKYNWSGAESGSFGNLGIALQSVYRLSPSLLDGMDFLDASGLDYDHDGDSGIYGNLLTTRYQAGESQVISGTFLNSTRQTDIVCARIQNGIPCGYGPGNTSSSNTQMYSLSDDALIGETSIQASVFSTDGLNINDELNRYVDGEAEPNGFDTLSQSRGYQINATLPAKERHTLSISAYSVSGDTLTTPLVVESAPYYNGESYSDYSAIQLNDSIHSNEHLTLGESIGLSRASNANGSVLGSFAATWRPDPRDTFSASYALGGVSASPSRSQILSDPASLRFTCGTNGLESVAYGNAPGDQPGPSSSISQRVGYTRTFKGGSLTFTLYNQIQQGVVLPVQVNGNVLESAGTIDAAYVSAVNAIYQSPAGCNSTTPLAASQLYFSTPVGNTNRVYQGGSITGYATVGGLVIQPFWNVNVSKAVSNSPFINNIYSITISGQQLPNVPLQRGGIVLDYKAPHSVLEWLADAQYTGANNPANLPKYTQFDAGVSWSLSRGSLTFAASNITNAYGGIFASPTNAVPYYTQNGIAIPTLARPLTPRNYSFTYNVKFGPGALGNTHVATPSVGGGRGGGRGAGGNGFFVGNAAEGGGPQQGGQNGGGFRRAITPLPSSPPANPLDVTSGESCTGDAQAQATKLSSELKSYVAQIEAAKTAAGYPTQMVPPQFDDATVTYHGMGTTYALTIVPKTAAAADLPTVLASTVVAQAAAAPSPGPNGQGAPRRGGGGPGGAFRVFFGCLTLHVAQADDITSRHLYQSNNALFTAPQITFMPETGLYIAVRPPQAGQESFRVYALPAKAPSAPFEVRTAASTCTPELSPTAAEALGELKKYFASGVKPAMWTISPHTSKNGTWYQLTPGDPAIIGALLMCGRVAAVAPSDIVDKGWDGAMPPSLNYAEPLGLYVIRQVRVIQGPPPSGQ